MFIGLSFQDTECYLQISQGCKSMKCCVGYDVDKVVGKRPIKCINNYILTWVEESILVSTAEPLFSNRHGI